MKTDPVTIVKKEYRTLKAISNLLAEPLYALHGELPPLGEVGHVNVYSSYGDYRLSYRRLPSGRLGKWRLSVVNCIDSVDYPEFLGDYKADYYTGYGQHSKWETIDLDQYQTIEL